LPEIGRSIGRGLREFRQATSEVQKNISLDEDEEKEQPQEKKAQSKEEGLISSEETSPGKLENTEQQA
jgi:Sec-independent protein translocase protein TatA